MPMPTWRPNALRSAIRSKVEHVFARQKARLGMTIRTIELARPRAVIIRQQDPLPGAQQSTCIYLTEFGN